MRKTVCFLLILAAVLALCACAVVPDPSQSGTPGTELPTTETTVRDPEHTLAPYVTVPPTEMNGILFSQLKDFEIIYLYDKQGKSQSLRYGGGEAEVPLSLRGETLRTTDAYDVVLFVNGQPQPFRFGEEGEYSLRCRLKADRAFSIYASGQLHFIPVTGRKGEKLSCALVAYPQLDQSPRDKQAYPFLDDFRGYQVLAFTLEMQADPPQQEPVTVADPPVVPRILSLRYEDCDETFDSAEYGTERSKRFCLTVDGRSARSFEQGYGYKTGTPSRIRIEYLWPAESDFSIYLYYNRELISLPLTELQSLRVPEGKKLVLELELVLPELTDYAVFHAFAVEKQRQDAWHEPVVGNDFFYLTGSAD